MSWVDTLMGTDETPGLDGAAKIAGDEGAGAIPAAPSVPPTGPPPPPPAPRPGPRRQPAKQRALDRVRALPARYQLVGGALIVVAATVITTRAFIHPVDEQSIVRQATADALAQTQQQLASARAEATQIAVPAAFVWTTCEVGLEAQLMIGGDPRTGGNTLNPERAAAVDRQARQLLTAFFPQDMRLVSPSLGALKVSGDNQAEGVALFDCTARDKAAAAPAAAPVEAPPTTVAVAAG